MKRKISGKFEFLLAESKYRNKEKTEATQNGEPGDKVTPSCIKSNPGLRNDCSSNSGGLAIFRGLNYMTTDIDKC